MSANVYMTITDEGGKVIEGSSTDQTHPKSVEVVSWSHGFSQPTTAATKSSDQQATSRANHMDFNFAKFFDKASDDLCLACWTGQQLKKVEVMCYRASGAKESGGGSTEYLVITMEDVIVASYSISGGGDELPIESLSFNYTKIEYKYAPVNPETGKPEKAAPISHDLSKNTVA